MSDSKELSLANVQRRWLNQINQHGVEMLRPVSLQNAVGFEVKLSNNSVIVRTGGEYFRELAVGEEWSITAGQYVSHGFQYFDDLTAKFEKLQITFVKPRYTDEDVAELKEFFAKQRVLLFGENDAMPDQADMGMFYRRAHLEHFTGSTHSHYYRRNIQYGDSPTYSEEYLQRALDYVPPAWFTNDAEYTHMGKPKVLYRGNNTGGEGIIYAMASIRTHYRLTESPVQPYLVPIDNDAAWTAVLAPQFGGYPIEEIEKELLGPVGIVKFDPESDQGLKFFAKIRHDGHLEKLKRKPDWKHIRLTLPHETPKELPPKFRAQVGEVHKLMDYGRHVRWMLNMGGMLDKELLKDDPSGYEKVYLSIIGGDEECDAQDEPTRQRSLARFLMVSAFLSHREGDGYLYPFPGKGEDWGDVSKRRPDSLSRVPKGRGYMLSRHPKWAGLYDTSFTDEFLVGTDVQSLRLLGKRTCSTWEKYFHQLSCDLKDITAAMTEANDDSASRYIEILKVVDDCLLYLEQHTSDTFWSKLSTAEAYLECEYIRQRLAKTFADPVENYALLELFGRSHIRHSYSSYSFYNPDHGKTSSFNLYDMKLAFSFDQEITLEEVMRRLEKDRRPAPPPPPPTKPEEVNIPKVQTGVQVAAPVEKESWIDRLFNYFFR